MHEVCQPPRAADSGAAESCAAQRGRGDAQTGARAKSVAIDGINLLHACNRRAESPAASHTRVRYGMAALGGDRRLL